MKGFSGEYAGSSKVAGLAIQINNAEDELENKMVFEIGFSQDYEDLLSVLEALSRFMLRRHRVNDCNGSQASSKVVTLYTSRHTQNMAISNDVTDIDTMEIGL